MIPRLIYNSLALLLAITFSGSAGALQTSLAAGLFDESDDTPEQFDLARHPLAAGEVVAVDRASGTITVRRRPVPEFFMTETTTVILRVSDGSMLEGLTSGDKIRFRLERSGATFLIVGIEHSN